VDQPKASLLEFPCAYPIKVFGAAIPELIQAVLTIVQKHAPDFDKTTLEIRASKNHRYQAITATVSATSQAQLDAIYQDLSSHELIIMAL
jgi:putative lipoic acid-binding regulatory protein